MQIHVLVIGNECVGKSSLIDSLQGKPFIEPRNATIGLGWSESYQDIVDVNVKFEFLEVDIININMLSSIDAKIDYVLLCFDSTEKSSFKFLCKAKTFLMNNFYHDAAFLLVGCKSDEMVTLSPNEVKALINQSFKVADKMNASLVYTSAKTNFLITELNESIIFHHQKGKPISNILSNLCENK